MKPQRIVLIAVVAIIVIGAGIYFYFMFANGTVPGITGGTASSTGVNEPILPASQVLTGTPTSATFTLGTTHGSVQVNNFYLSDPPVTDGGETVIIASTTDYLITYDTTDSSFWIGIDPGQFGTVRPAAEQAFVSVLGVSEADACKLDVSVGVFYSATSSLSGQSFPLGFCAGLNFGQ